MNNLGEVSIHVTDETRNLKYYIHINRKFNIILGDSGSGKTMLCNTISYINENKDDTNYKISTRPNPNINVRLLRNNDDYIQIIRNSKSTVFIVDDNVKIPDNIDFRDAILDSDNSVILMRRKKLVPYQISIDAIYELKYCKGVIENKSKYKF